MSDEGAYEVRTAISATEESDGSYVILELEMKAGHLALALPTDAVAPLAALLLQTLAKAQAVAGNVRQQVSLEILGTEVFRNDQNVDIHLRLTNGADLPIGMTVSEASSLFERLAWSLEQESSSGARH